MSRGKKTNPLRKEKRNAYGIARCADQKTSAMPKLQAAPAFIGDGVIGTIADNNFIDVRGLTFLVVEEFSCDESGCDEENICRCGHITGVKLDKINYPEFINEVYGQSDPETVLAITTVLKDIELATELNWDVEVEHDYYGDEAGAITLELRAGAKCDAAVKELLCFTNPADQLAFANNFKAAW